VDSLLFVLRLTSAALLIMFVAAVFVMMWHDYRALSLEISTRTRPQGRLLVIHGNEDGMKPGAAFPLLPLTRLGRAPTNTIMIEDAFTSSEHATITLRGGKWWLEDHGSSNGTQLNGYRVREATIVSTGDVISIGQVDLKIEME
jgi:FHA domain